MSETHEPKGPVERRVRAPQWFALTYLIYIVFFESLIWGGCAYVVFWRGVSGWWFALALVVSGAAYGPRKWRSLFDEKAA